MEKKKTRATFEVDPEKWERFRKTCKLHGRSRGETIRRYIDDYLSLFERNKGKLIDR